MGDWLKSLRVRYRINEDAEVRIGLGWRGIIERFYESAKAILIDPARMSTTQIKQKLGRLDIHVHVPDEYRSLINWHIGAAEQQASHTCEYCASPYGSLTTLRHIIECDDCRTRNLRRDQRTRRATEIASAARHYVRDCARAARVLDIEEWATRRWRKDSSLKQKAMLDILRDEIEGDVPVVDVWRRFDVSGRIARELIGAKSYTDLYDILRVNGMEPGFQPAGIAQLVTEGKMSKSDLGELFGIEEGEIDDFVSAWLE